MILKARKIGNILFHQVFQKQIQRNIHIFIVYFQKKKSKKKKNINFPKDFSKKYINSPGIWLTNIKFPFHY